MAGKLEGKVAFITGVARGQGRSHAIRLAEEGANIIGIDLCENIKSLKYDGATEDDLAQTIEMVKATGRDIYAVKGDVRSIDDMQSVVDEGVERFGRLDTVIANAGIVVAAPTWEMTEDEWNDVIDINLTGVFHTAKAAVPSMIKADNGGSMMFISSIAGMKGYRNLANYTSAKHGIVGMMRVLANELAPYAIRVNTIHPTNIETTMILNDGAYKTFAPHLEHPTKEDAMEGFAAINLLPVPYIDPAEISNAVLWLASDESRYVTGIQLPVDAGVFVKT